MIFINKAYADLPPDMIISDIKLSNPCNVSWIVEKIEIKKWEHECSDNIFLYIKSNNNLYKVSALKNTQTECTFDWSTMIYWYNNLPKKWDEIDILVSGNWYNIFNVDGKNHENFYVYDQILGKNFETCSSNSNFIEFHKDYFIIWAWIILLIILWIIFYKKFKK